MAKQKVEVCEWNGKDGFTAGPGMQCYTHDGSPERKREAFERARRDSTSQPHKGQQKTKRRRINR